MKLALLRGTIRDLSHVEGRTHRDSWDSDPATSTTIVRTVAINIIIAKLRRQRTRRRFQSCKLISKGCLEGTASGSADPANKGVQ